MLKSMTGYGRAQQKLDGMLINIELKSVNSRFLEFNPRVSRSYAFLEDRLRTRANETISRGKVECVLTIDDADTNDAKLEINRSLVRGYVEAAESLSKEFGLQNDLTINSLFHQKDIFTVVNVNEDEDRLWENVRQVFDEAAAAFSAMREKEGQKLSEDLLLKADSILKLVDIIEERSPQTNEEYRQKLYSKLNEILKDRSVDEARILQEAAIVADKTAVDEETVRLRSHISQLKSMLKMDGPIGRKLDFLVQEMNREANTIGSKCSDLKLSKIVIDMKSEIEKIREQIQNIE